MKLMVIAFVLLLSTSYGYSQEIKLKHLGGNTYQTKSYGARHVKYYLKNNYDDLEKDEKGMIRAIIMNFQNDTLSIILYDAEGLLREQIFKDGKVIPTTIRTRMKFENKGKKDSVE